MPAAVIAAFLHGLQHRRLGLGRGPVDLVGQADLREDRPFLELEEPLAVGRLHDHVRAQDVGRHQVRRELDAGEIQVQHLGQGADQERLAQPRHAFQQAMPADEQAGQYPVDDLLVADDHPGDLLADRPVAVHEFLGPSFHGLGNTHRAFLWLDKSESRTLECGDWSPLSTGTDANAGQKAATSRRTPKASTGMWYSLHSFLGSNAFFLALSNRDV